MSFNQINVNVQGFLTKQIAPRLDNALIVTRATDTSQKDYQLAEQYGTQGAAYLVKKPIRFNVENTLAFDATNSGSYQQQYMSVAVTNERRTNYQVPNITTATFTPESIHGGNIEAQTQQLGEEIDRQTAIAASFGGYRFFGDPLVPSGQLQTINEVNRMIAIFRSFGGMGHATCFFSLITASNIKTQSYQNFTLNQNNDFSDAGTIGQLQGIPNITFMETPIIVNHTAGTAADDALNVTGYTIANVIPTPPNIPGAGTPNGTTQIDLTEMTPGTTVVPNDVIQINAGAGLAQLRFLNYTNYGIFSNNPVQGRVITGGTVAGDGTLTITISPALIFDNAVTDPDVNRNLSRAIVPGTDVLQIGRSHRAGFIFFKEYIKYISPPLPPRVPFPSQTVTTDRGISVRASYGAIFNAATDQFVSDVYFGYGVAEEGVCRILLPLDA